MANFFDQFDESSPGAGGAGRPAPSAQGGGNFFDQFDEPRPKGKPGGMEDVVKSAGAGLAKGAIGIPGLPGDLKQLSDYIGSLPGRGLEKLGLLPPKPDNPDIGSLISIPNSADIQGVVEGVTGEFYKPQTTAGKYAESIASMAPAGIAGPGGAIRRAAGIVLGGAGAEAAGQLAEGSPLEPLARVAGGLVGFAAPNVRLTPSRALENGLEGLTKADVDAATQVMQKAASQGVKLSWDEAIAQATGGKGNLSSTRRVVENSEQGAPLKEMMAQRPGQVEVAGRQAFGDIAPINPAPSSIGPAISEAARGAVADTPQGLRLAEDVWRAGPRTTAEEAGNIIQPELRRVYEGREGMRAALADQDYSAARNAPATIPLDGGFGFRDVTSHYLPPEPYPVVRDANGQMRKMTPAEVDAEKLIRPVPQPKMTRGDGGKFQKWGEGEKASADDAAWQDILTKREQRQKEINITERMPVIGLEPTKFGQADVSSVAQHLDEAMQTAKGMTRQALSAARKAIETPSGELDYSITGLDNGRKAITDLISQAKLSGANNAVRELEGALGTLDQALEQVPAYGQARRSFKAASEPLAPFEGERSPAKIVERDQFEKRFAMPPEQAPKAIEKGGASGAQDFADVASQPAREAYAQYLTTKALDRSGREGIGVSSQSIRDFMRENEDALRRFPEVGKRLEQIARSRDALDKALTGPLGKLVNEPTTKQAIDALFPSNPLANSEKEIDTAVRALAKRRPDAARDLIRAHAESVFNEATQANIPGQNAFGGAKFASVIAGNPQQAKNLEAAVRALPNGDTTWSGFKNFLDTMEATGKAPRAGSNTAPDTGTRKLLSEGGLANLTAGPVKAIKDFAEKARLGSNMGQLASILTDPKQAGLLRSLAKTNAGSSKAQAIVGRIILRSDAAYNNTSRRGE